MSDTLSPDRPVPRWLQRWAVATVAITAIPVSLGGWVTTIKAGMADVHWPTTPWYMFGINWQIEGNNVGLIVEHSHRVAGYLIGLCVIVLAVGLWRTARSSTLRWLGIIALAAVIVQGMLGGFRVVLNELFGSQLATIHGVFAQLVFALLTAVAVLCFPGRPEGNVSETERRRLRRLTAAFAAVVFLQIVWGAILRHTPNPLSQRMHLLTAFAVVGLAVLVIRVAGAPQYGRRFSRPRAALMGLLTLQVLLGVEAWLGKFPPGVLPDLVTPGVGQIAVRILHVLTGAGVFATSVALALTAYLPAGVRWSQAVEPNHVVSRLGETQSIGETV